MKKTLLFAIPGGILLLFLVIHTAQSFPSRHFRGGMGQDFLEYRLDRLSRDLNLNESQQAQLEALKKDLQSMIEDRAAKRTETRQNISDQMSAKDFNVDAITGILHNRIDERARFSHEFVDRIGEFCKQLTPAQRKILAERVLDRIDIGQ